MDTPHCSRPCTPLAAWGKGETRLILVATWTEPHPLYRPGTHVDSSRMTAPFGLRRRPLRRSRRAGLVRGQVRAVRSVPKRSHGLKHVRMHRPNP
jgi:hypothetical protein